MTYTWIDAVNRVHEHIGGGDDHGRQEHRAVNYKVHGAIIWRSAHIDEQLLVDALINRTDQLSVRQAGRPAGAGTVHERSGR